MRGPQVTMGFNTKIKNSLITGMIRGYPNDLGASIWRAGSRAITAGHNWAIQNPPTPSHEILDRFPNPGYHNSQNVPIV